MSTTTTEKAIFTFQPDMSEPAWLVEHRQAAWSDFEALGWPNRKDEEWIRTDIRLFKPEKYSVVTEAREASSVEPLLSQGVELSGQSTTVDGICTASHLQENIASQGVVFGSLRQALAEHGDLIQGHLGRAIDAGFDRFAALNSAMWSGGHFLYVPKGVVVKQPFHALSVLSDGATDFGRLLVVLDEGAEATFLTELASADPEADALHCGAIEIFVKDNAKLRFVNLQDWGDRTWHFAHQKALVGKDASIQWTIGALGSRLAKVNQHVELVGEGADSQVNGVMFTEGKQHLSYHTQQYHRAAHCHSDFLYKAALQDQSRTVWRGMIKVDPGAQKTDGYQRNDNLLLSSQARADSIPGLEIEADDVRCTHGSTSGRVDDELIFYAQARGFTRQEAIRNGCHRLFPAGL